MPKMHGKKYKVFGYVDPDQYEELDRIAKSKRGTISNEIRLAVDLFLAVNRSRSHSNESPIDPDKVAA